MRPGPRAAVLVVGLPAALLFALWFVAWRNQYGSYAKSPQTVEMSIGTQTIVAGGRAKMWFAQIDEGAYVELKRKGESRGLWLQVDEPSDPVFGLTVELVEVQESMPPRAKFEVRWDSE